MPPMEAVLVCVYFDFSIDICHLRRQYYVAAIMMRLLTYASYGGGIGLRLF